VSDDGLVAIARRRPDGAIELCAPCPGVLRWPPRRGAHAMAGEPFAALEVLGRRRPLRAPADGDGLIAEVPGGAPRPVGHGDVLAVLGAIAIGGARPAAGEAGPNDGALVLRATASGRFYRRSGPDKPPLVSEGDVIEHGHAVALLEVMKTFSRIHYGGEGLPSRARVVRVLPADGADVEVGDPLVEVEPA
jgi:acetyl-CoA carboxylase biotin carboxyl carrier protein